MSGGGGPMLFTGATLVNRCVVACVMDREEPPSSDRRRLWLLLRRTLGNAWQGNIFSEAAKAAFWQALSLTPLMLGLLGMLGYLGDVFGQGVVTAVREEILDFSRTIFNDEVVDGLILETVDDILTVGRGGIVSLGFLISLWAGSSAMASFVDAITVAHHQSGVRNDVWHRVFALLLYVASLLLLIVVLPLVAIGPDLLARLVPEQWESVIQAWVSWLYYPTLGVLLVVGLATLYKLALPHRLPWHRGLPGAVLAMLIFLLTSAGLRFYLTTITQTGYTYGALATPITFLLFLFFIGLAVVGGAYFNSTIDELWPVKRTRERHRKARTPGSGPTHPLNRPRHQHGRHRRARATIPPGAPRLRTGGARPDAASAAAHEDPTSLTHSGNARSLPPVEDTPGQRDVDADHP